MASKKVLVVFGATGNQGGSVIKSVLSDPIASQEFRIRGITRDPNKPNAQALAAKGVECVPGDINNKESLHKALEGAYAVYAVTNYWEKMDAKLELQQGKNVADVAKEVGVQHLIFSTLLNIKKLTNGAFPNVYHFDAKADIEEYIRSIGVPASFFQPGFYMSNLDTMFTPAPQEPHPYTMALPMPPTTQIPWFDAADDTGKFVKGMLLNREKVLGQRVTAATAYCTPNDVIEIFKKVKPEAGKTAQFFQPDKETYKGFLAGAGMPDFVQEELYENMAFMNEYGYYGKRTLDEGLALLTEKPTTLEEFFQKGKWAAVK